MTKHFNQLTEAQQERLAILIEECAEVAQAGCKILRHGYESNNKGTLPETNREALERELSDLFYTLYRMSEAGEINIDSIRAKALQGKKDIEKYLHHQ